MKEGYVYLILSRDESNHGFDIGEIVICAPDGYACDNGEKCVGSYDYWWVSPSEVFEIGQL